MLTSAQIRQQFIDYFVEKHAHSFVPSSPVVPHDDPTLMFANAGMNQFKDVFLGTGTRDYTRAANTQKCIRAGGKHNDLDDVGKDTYHHTFFEMLGNWSFGDYFKKEAITWAWDLLTNVWGVEADRLHATYFEGDESEGLEPDNEARELWSAILPPERIHPGNKKDNFWEMGDTGPCGPCSELHIDLTPEKNGGHLVNGDDARVIEIWNLVFIQFNRDTSGKLSTLPAKHVDTGMGFERIAAVLQGKTSNYDTDIWTPIFAAIKDITGAPAYSAKLGDSPEAQIDMAYRVIADHIRTLTFALTDGATVSNEGRGYVLRRILRRAVRHGWQTLDMKKPFLHKLVPTVVDAMGEAFPELKKHAKKVTADIKDEEESFGRTLERGIALFNDAADAAKGKTVAADQAFKLHDTFGFPIDLTQIMAEERGMTVDIDGYHELMEKAKDLARDAGGSKVSGQALLEIVQKEKPTSTEFVGYDHTSLDSVEPISLFRIVGDSYRTVKAAEAGAECIIVTGKTPFYAEAGGQVGDSGVIGDPDGDAFRVNNTQRVGDTIFHVGVVEQGVFNLSADAAHELTFRVDPDRRAAIMANHTATHIMNHKLRAVLGDHIAQKGSLVDEDKTRFDFSHNAPLSDDEIEQIETQVNHDIGADLPVYTEYAPQEDALKINSLRAVFGEKVPAHGPRGVRRRAGEGSACQA